MLAIFASHSQKMGERGAVGDGGDGEGTKRQQPFAEQIVPFYAQCLIDVGLPTTLSFSLILPRPIILIHAHYSYLLFFYWIMNIEFLRR